MGSIYRINDTTSNENELKMDLRGFWVLTQQLLGSFDYFLKPYTFGLGCWNGKKKYCSVNTGHDFEIYQFI